MKQYNYKTYSRYAEKIEVLREVFGEWPPPFDAPWCLQVSKGRCGSNALWEMVCSFLGERATGEPPYELLDDAKHHDSKQEELVHDSWIPKPGEKYLYYTPFDADPHRLHYPIFFWMLNHCSKVVLLLRHDHLTRAISFYYANILTRMYRNDDMRTRQQMHFYPDVFRKPLNIEELEHLVAQSVVEITVLERLVKVFVPPERLHEISFYDLYHRRTLEVLGGLVDFLECDRKTTVVGVRVQRETLFDEIPNLSEVLSHFDRDSFEEIPEWKPDSSFKFIESIQRRVNENILAHLNTNIEPQAPIRFKINIPRNVKHYDLDPDMRFYLEAIPTSARYVDPENFAKLPNLYEELYVLDTRWENSDFQPPIHLQHFFEVTDVQRNSKNVAYPWICGFSGFFLKYLQPDQCEHHQHRIEPQTHNRLIESIQQMIDYENRCPETLLRFYVSPEVWNRVHEVGYLYKAGTEFCKMADSSEESQLGVSWRMLALFDKDFQWALESDLTIDEDWVFQRIDEGSRAEFMSWIQDSAWAGEYLFSDGNYPDTYRRFGEHQTHWSFGEFDFISGGGIVTYPQAMPSATDVLVRSLAERPRFNTFYHADTDCWSIFPDYHRQIPKGWEGWGFDQILWSSLKKMIPVRHIVAEQSLNYIESMRNISDRYLTRRIVAQLLKEGSEFIHYKTLEPVFTLKGSY